MQREQLKAFRNSRHVSTGQAAQMLKVSVGTVCAYCDQGILESFQRKEPGGHRRVMLDSVMRLLQRWANEVEASQR